MVRKHLNFSVDEWVRLPWWQQRLYVEGLDEFIRAENGEEPDDGDTTTDDVGLASLGFRIG